MKKLRKIKGMVMGKEEKINISDMKGLFVEQLEKEIKNQMLTKTDLARLMSTSRAAVNRVLDPSYSSSLTSLSEAAQAVGKRLSVRLD